MRAVFSVYIHLPVGLLSSPVSTPCLVSPQPCHAHSRELSTPTTERGKILTNTLFLFATHQSPGSGASLSSSAHGSKEGGMDDHINVGVCCHDDGIVAPQLQNLLAKPLLHHHPHPLTHLQGKPPFSTQSYTRNGIYSENHKPSTSAQGYRRFMLKYSPQYLCTASEGEKIDLLVSSHGLPYLCPSAHVGADSSWQTVCLQNTPQYLRYGNVGQWCTGSPFPRKK